MNNRPVFHIMRLTLGLALLCSLVIGVVSPASATVRCYVKQDAGGLNNGSSWANAYTSLQSALGASSCTEVWVARGIYKPTSSTDRTKSFVLKSNVSIYGGFEGTETLLSQRNITAHLTILSGELGGSGNSDNSYHVVMSLGTNSAARLDGFTITAGNADGGQPYDRGGGLYNDSGSPALANLTFASNTVLAWGGGIYNEAGNPSLTNVAFNDNTAEGGGGMYNENSSPSLSHVTFTGNVAVAGGGGMANNNQSNPRLTNVIFNANRAEDGGGIHGTGSPSLRNVIFSNNSAYGTGGAMTLYQSGSSLVNVTFTGNSAHEGGGVFNYNGNLRLTNVTFSGNSALNSTGGGMMNSGSNSPRLMNVTFSGNMALWGAGIYNSGQSSPIITNSILYGDAGGEIYNESSSPVVSYSIIQGGYPGTGNLDTDPLLEPLIPAGGSTPTMPLGFGSPAIDKGINIGCTAKDQRGLIRPQGPRCDMGAYEYPQQKLALSSTGAEDGWVLESTETSNVGGSTDVSRVTLAVGDDAADRQGRSILSFNTALLPDSAVITSVALRVQYAGLVGTNPFLTHGNILADICTGSFNNNPALQIQDFQAAASRSAAVVIKNTPLNGWYVGKLAAANFNYVNTAGVTQFRLRFAKDDDDDLIADYLKFYSGNYITPAYRPKLVITYYTP